MWLLIIPLPYEDWDQTMIQTSLVPWPLFCGTKKGHFLCHANIVMSVILKESSCVSCQKGNKVCYANKVSKSITQKGSPCNIISKGIIISVTFERVIKFVILKGLSNLSHQKGCQICHTKRVTKSVTPKGLTNLSHQKGYQICHTKGLSNLSHQKGYQICHTKRVIKCHTKRLIKSVTPKGLPNMSHQMDYKMGFQICHTKCVITCINLKGSSHLSRQKGHYVYLSSHHVLHHIITKIFFNFTLVSS